MDSLKFVWIIRGGVKRWTAAVAQWAKRFIGLRDKIQDANARAHTLASQSTQPRKKNCICEWRSVGAVAASKQRTSKMKYVRGETLTRQRWHRDRILKSMLFHRKQANMMMMKKNKTTTESRSFPYAYAQNSTRFDRHKSVAFRLWPNLLPFSHSSLAGCAFFSLYQLVVVVGVAMHFHVTPRLRRWWCANSYSHKHTIHLLNNNP